MEGLPEHKSITNSVLEYGKIFPVFLAFVLQSFSFVQRSAPAVCHIVTKFLALSMRRFLFTIVAIIGSKCGSLYQNGRWCTNSLGSEDSNYRISYPLETTKEHNVLCQVY